MKIPLSQFEQFIDETILKRGLSYFKNGYVSPPEEITRGKYEATVVGTDEYLVELEIKDDTLVEYVCSCPYDMGPVCKHIVAVLFYMQQDILEIEPKVATLGSKKKRSTKNDTKKNTTTKKKTISEQIDEVLEKISHDDLKQFIIDKSAHNSPFRNLFLSSFAHQNTSESKELYAKQVKSILQTAAGREGFIYWNQAGNVGRLVGDLLNISQKHIENKNYKSAVYICTAVMEEMTLAFDFADDSNGDIGGSINYAFDLLDTITNENLPNEIRILLFEYFMSAAESKIYSGWDWHLGVLQLAAAILVDDKEGLRLIEQLEKSNHSEYEEEEAQWIKWTVIKKIQGETEAEKFIAQNITNPKLRYAAIAIAVDKKDYEKGIRLAKDGIEQNEKHKPGLIKDWQNWLLKIAQAQNDKQRIVEYARLLFIANFMNEQDYYALMKNNIQDKDWKNFVEELIKEISAIKNWFRTDIIANIYIREEWWDRLMQLVRQNASLQNLQEYEQYLADDYSAEIAERYEVLILEYVKSNVGRSHYKTACKYLRRMKKLGATEKVNFLVDFFKKEYPQRRALIEELNMV